jgi:WD40 repeat protein
MVTAAAFSRDEKRVVSGGEDGMILLWNLEDGKEVMPRPGHTKAVHSVALSKDGKYAITGGADKTIRVWDLMSEPPGRLVRPFEGGHQGVVTTVMFSADASRALSLGQDMTGRLWDVATGKELDLIDNNIMGASFGTKSGTALAARDGIVHLMELVSKKQRVSAVYRGQYIFQAIPSPTGRYFAVALNGNMICLCEVDRSDKRWTAPSPTSAQTALVFSPDGSDLVWGTEDGKVRRWSVKDAGSQAPLVFFGHTKAITSVASSPDNKFLAASAVGGKVIVWDTGTRKVVKEWQLAGTVHGLTFAADSRYLAMANGNGTVYIVRLKARDSR